MIEPVGWIDVPADGDLVQRHGFACEGWVLCDGERTVEASIDGVVVGSTRLGFRRADVEAAIDCGSRTASGFSFSCTPPERLRDRPGAQLVVTVRDRSECREVGRRWIGFSEVDYREHGHGVVLTDEHPGVLRREDVYVSGPPSAAADPLAVGRIVRFLRTADRVLDVGCGIGAYGRALAQLGYDWTGVEVRADFVDEMRRSGLRAEWFDGTRVPFDDAAFDVTICMEVLEHVSDCAPFLAEVARVTRRLAIFSVPNYEVLPVMARAYAIPWHMLEPDHKNFFTRRGLASVLRTTFAAVEVSEFGPLDFRTPDDVPLYNHLLAVASR